MVVQGVSVCKSARVGIRVCRDDHEGLNLRFGILGHLGVKESGTVAVPSVNPAEPEPLWLHRYVAQEKLRLIGEQ